MNATQQAAFRASTGMAPADLLIGIASIILTLAFVWGAWVAIGTFRAWQNGQVMLFDLVWNSLRAGIVLMVLGFYLQP